MQGLFRVTGLLTRGHSLALLPLLSRALDVVKWLLNHSSPTSCLYTFKEKSPLKKSPLAFIARGLLTVLRFMITVRSQVGHNFVLTGRGVRWGSRCGKRHRAHGIREG